MQHEFEFTEEQIQKLKALRPVYIDNTEIYELLEPAAGALRKLIVACGDDPARDGLQETPFRVIKAFLEYTKGYEEDPALHLRKTFDVDHDELVLVKDITFNSLCEHHFAPFFGKAHIAYIPNGRITGLSKFARLVDGYAKRFQVQERLTNQIGDAIQQELQPIGTAVVIEAQHYCMCGRGVMKPGAATVTSYMRGAFRNNSAARKEVLDLIRS